MRVLKCSRTQLGMHSRAHVRATFPALGLARRHPRGVRLLGDGGGALRLQRASQRAPLARQQICFRP
eukprot:6204025-Pleurochrysis_carterae.AAC.1